MPSAMPSQALPPLSLGISISQKKRYTVTTLALEGVSRNGHRYTWSASVTTLAPQRMRALHLPPPAR